MVVACATATGGHLYCWGSNGEGTRNGTHTANAQTLPLEVETPAGTEYLSTVTAVSRSCYSTCAMVTGGHLYCWGYNTSGPLRNGTTTQEDLPVLVEQ